MRNLDLRRLLSGRSAYVLAGAAASLGLAVGAVVALGAHRARPAAPLDTAAVAALQNTAFTHAEAQPGLDAPQNVPVKLQRGETLEAAVRRAGVGPAEAQLAVGMLSKAMDIAHLKAGMLIQTAIAQPRAARGEARLIGLSLRTGPASAITISRSFDGALRLRELDEKLRDETTVADGEIEGSLYESVQHVGATPGLTVEVAKLFAHRLDFQRDLHPGDSFKLVFDRKVTEAGRTVQTGELKYAELHGVKFYRFVRGDDVEYFDEFGKSIKGFLLHTPVDGAHITSLFGMRLHPVLGYTRAHQGIDFGAGTGTPILAAGDGVVAQASPWGGYGNWLRIRHSDGWDTGYGHISRYAAGIHPGVRVRQGQVVAYVGATGLATGPHLHYEIWKNGQRVNPLSAKAPQGTVLAGADLAKFKDQKAEIDGLLAHGPAPRALAVADTHQAPARLQR